MDSITISSRDGRTRVVMPRVRTVKVGGEEVSTEKEMASGKLVKEMRGFRAVVTAQWDWLPARTIRDLHALLRLGGYFSVTYPDPVDGAATGLFSVSYPETGIFRFVGEEPRWHGVSLTMRGQEVV